MYWKFCLKTECECHFPTIHQRKLTLPLQRRLSLDYLLTYT